MSPFFSEGYLYFAVLLAVAGVPAFVLARMPSLRAHPPWVKVLVFLGALVWLLPLALIPALVIVFYVFGIDMID